MKVEFECPSCQLKMAAETTAAGGDVTCPSCSTEFHVDGSAAALPIVKARAVVPPQYISPPQPDHGHSMPPVQQPYPARTGYPQHAGYPQRPVAPGYQTPALPYSNPQSTVPQKKQIPIALLVAGCLIVIVGSILPWFSMKFLTVSKTVRGLDGDGVITLILAGIALGLGFVKSASNEKFLAITCAILTGIAGIIGFYDLSNVEDAANQFAAGMGGFLKINIGAGLFLVILGGAMAATGSILRILKSPAPTGSPPAA